MAVVEKWGASGVVDVGAAPVFWPAGSPRAAGEETGVDPARASPDVARARPHADRLTWMQGTA